MSDGRQNGRHSWTKWLTGGGGVALAGLGLEVYRRLVEVQTVAYQKAQEANGIQELLLELKGAAFAKATQADALDNALKSCHQTELALVELLKACGG